MATKRKRSKRDLDLSSILAPIEETDRILVEDLDPKLKEQFKKWAVVIGHIRLQTFKIVDFVYSEDLKEEAKLEKAPKVIVEVKRFYESGKSFKPKLAPIIEKYLKLEYESQIFNFTFWHDVSLKYKLWLVPCLRIRQGFVIVQDKAYLNAIRSKSVQ